MIVLSLLMVGQASNPWLEVARMGNDPKIAEIWTQLNVPPDPETKRPPGMPVYREIARSVPKLTDVMALCAMSSPPAAPPPFSRNPEYMAFLGGLKGAFRELIAVSAVSFYEGNPGVGAKLLKDGLRMSYRMQSTSVLGGLVGIATQSIVLGEYEKRLGRLSVSDLDGLEQTVRSWLATKPLILLAFRAERDAMVDFAPEWVRNPWSSLEGNGFSAEDLKGLKAKWETLSPAARQAEGDRLKKLFDEGYDAITARLDGAESTWPGKEKSTVESAKSDSVAESVAPVLLMPFGPIVGGPVAKGWTQLRLLRLHAVVRAFKWRHARWPKSLAEAAGKDAFDPVANRPFTYQVDGSPYTLRSEGWPAVGPIELRYRRDPNHPSAEGGA